MKVILQKNGFTFIEVIVALSIIVIISGIVLFSFTGLNEGAGLNTSSRELALTIRRAQNMSLAVVQLNVGGTPQIPQAVGVRLEKSSPIYFIFGDLTATLDNKYTNPSEKIGEDEKLRRNITITAFKDGFGAEYPTNVLHILFAAPEATIMITDDSGILLGDLVNIELATPNQPIRTITVRVSGQISIQ